jgi:EAL domain-containing protein (putative c-di-GMP-specific phosphodiesterase class I)
MEALKIDQGFIRGIRESQEDAAIVRSVVELAHTLGMVVIAEGVETDWHYACLRDIGCDFVQGYYFSPPVQADKIPALIAQFGAT